MSGWTVGNAPEAIGDSGEEGGRGDTDGTDAAALRPPHIREMGFAAAAELEAPVEGESRESVAPWRGGEPPPPACPW